MNAGLFKNKYRIASARYKGWNYADDGFYFVTICTKNRKLFFGSVKDYEMELNDVGKIVADEWQNTAKIRNNILLDEWIIMPNHLHGILIINNHTVETPRWGVSNQVNMEMSGTETPQGIKTETPQRGVSNQANMKTPGTETPQGIETETPQRGVSTERGNGGGRKIEWQSGSLGAVINQFKGVCTKKINQDFPEINFSWQTRFFDHIIKSEKAAEKIRKYIHDNPARWEFDKNNSEDLWM